MDASNRQFNDLIRQRGGNRLTVSVDEAPEKVSAKLRQLVNGTPSETPAPDAPPPTPRANAGAGMGSTQQFTAKPNMNDVLREVARDIRYATKRRLW
jgi:hypothetical protein